MGTAPPGPGWCKRPRTRPHGRRPSNHGERCGGWMDGPGAHQHDGSQSPTRMVTTWSRRGGGEPNHHNAPHTAPCCRLRTPPPPPPLCPPAGSIQDQVGVGGRSGVHRRRGGSRPSRGASSPALKCKKRKRVPQHPTLHPRTGAPCRDTRPVQSPPTCTFTHGARVPTPGQVHGRAPWPRREATPPRRAFRNHAESAAN